MKLDLSCYFRKHDFSLMPFLWKQWPPDFIDGRWMIVLNWFGFELVISGTG